MIKSFFRVLLATTFVVLFLDHFTRDKEIIEEPVKTDTPQIRDYDWGSGRLILTKDTDKYVQFRGKWYRKDSVPEEYNETIRSTVQWIKKTSWERKDKRDPQLNEDDVKEIIEHEKN